jgi:hypothetical protein
MSQLEEAGDTETGDTLFSTKIIFLTIVVTISTFCRAIQTSTLNLHHFFRIQRKHI